MEIIEQSTEDIKIHRDHLEDDWESHSELALNWHLKYAEFVYRRDNLKESLSIEEAKLAQHIRSKPEDFGLLKITEGSVFELLKTNDRLQEFRQDLITTEYEVNLLKGVTIAFDHRKKALEELVSLYIAGYFSPKLKAELKPDIDTQVASLNKLKLPRKL